jgi:nitroreductase
MKTKEQCSHRADSLQPTARPRFSRRAFLKAAGVGAASLAAVSQAPSVVHAQEKSSTADVGLFATIYSTRAMRRLKPDPIPEETLRKIVEAGTHAPSGGNRQDWGFILVRDPALKRFIRDHYVATQKELQNKQPLPSELPPTRQRAMKAAAYLAEHLHEAPVLLLTCSLKEYPPWAHNPRASTATVHGSIYLAVQNIVLACRALGIGTVVTTTHCFFEDELKQKLGVPENMEISALLPLGFPKGKFGPTQRKPVDEVMFWDRWGSAAKA